MENKINVAELLKDCPKGMELDCTVFENLTFEEIDEVNSRILCNIQGDNGKIGISFNKFGCYSELNQAKCVIFPKGKTTWKGFVPPIEFKDGDVIYNPGIKAVAIFYKQTDNATISHCFLNVVKELKICHYHCKLLSDWRLSSEEEKQKLFKAIKDNGYKWNVETKILERLIEPKFKVGDKIVKKNGVCVPILITKVSDEYYYSNTESSVGVLSISEQDNYELVPNKFDIGSLKPFESRVLVRDKNTDKWKSSFWGFYDIDNAMNYPYECCGNSFAQCIPYEGNEHLLGTTDDCDKFFKIWE